MGIFKRVFYAAFVFMFWSWNIFAQDDSLTAIIEVEQNEGPYMNGKKHGETLKDEIKKQVAAWEKGISNDLNIDRDSIFNIINVHTGFIDKMKEQTPELLEEINGIADGASIDRQLILAYNLGEEIYNFCTANFESCSNIAFSNGTQNVLAYNQDLPFFLHGNNKIVVLKHCKYAVFTMPGSIGLSGVSENVAVSCNSLPMLRMNPNGLPLSCFIRKILLLDSIQDVRAFINKTPLAIGQNLMLNSNSGILNAEISKNEINWIEQDSTGYFYHTNFPLKNKDFKYSDYTSKECDRYNFLDFSARLAGTNSLNLNSDFARLVCTMNPILNDETFLRFVCQYSSLEEPIITLINPVSSEELNIKF